MAMGAPRRFSRKQRLVAIIAPGLTLLGGVPGLAIGYAVKYQLDRRFVFRRWENTP